MRKARGTKDVALDFLRDRNKVPDEFIRRRIAAARREIAARYEQKSEIKRQAVKLFTQIQEPIRPSNDDPKAARAITGLLDLHKKLAKQKILAPSVASELGGIISGGFTAKFTPPFDYAYTIPFLTAGQPSLIGSASKGGELSTRAVSDFTTRSVGTMYTELGVFFHPFVGPARLTVSANPAYTRQWWTNSLFADSAVRSFGSVVVGIFGQQGRIGPITGAVDVADQWDETTTQEVRFDFGSSPTIPATAQLEVDPSFTYSLFVAAQTHVEAVGWPGSLAGAIISLTVPSITLQFDPIPVATQN